MTLEKRKRAERKKLLFVVNTLGRAGAETALLELLKKLDGCRCFPEAWSVRGW